MIDSPPPKHTHTLLSPILDGTDPTCYASVGFFAVLFPGPSPYYKGQRAGMKSGFIASLLPRQQLRINRFVIDGWELSWEYPVTWVC